MGFPPEADAEFVCARADVREVYHRPYDPTRPPVCLDEQSKQLIWEVRTPTRRSRVDRIETEYERNGTANRFLVFEPLADRRQVTVTDRRTTVECNPSTS